MKGITPTRFNLCNKIGNCPFEKSKMVLVLDNIEVVNALQSRIKELEEIENTAISEGLKLAGELGKLKADYKELKELILTKDEAESIIKTLDEDYAGDKEILAKLQKIIDKG